MIKVKAKKKPRFFQIYILKLMKEHFPRHSISTDSKQQLNSFVKILATKLSKTARNLTTMSGRKTIATNDIKKAIQLTFPPSFQEYAIENADECVERFNDNVSKVMMTKQQRAGITFPPSMAIKFLREFGKNRYMVTMEAPIFLAGVLETLVYELINNTIYTMKKRKRITVKHLQTNVLNSEFNELFTKFNISFLGGGVLPHINPILTQKRKQKRGVNKSISRSVDRNGRQHRFRPGTVSLRNIKKQQKMSNSLVMAKKTFDNLVRSRLKKIVNESDIDGVNKNIKLSKKIFPLLQHVCETYITDRIAKSMDLAVYNNRLKLHSNDILYMHKLLSGKSTLNLLPKPTVLTVIAEDEDEEEDVVVETDNDSILESDDEEESDDDEEESDDDEEESDEELYTEED